MDTRPERHAVQWVSPSGLAKCSECDDCARPQQLQQAYRSSVQLSENVHLREVVIVDALILSSCCGRSNMALQAVPELLQLAVDEQHLAVQLQSRAALQVRSVLAV